MYRKLTCVDSSWASFASKTFVEMPLLLGLVFYLERKKQNGKR